MHADNEFHFDGYVIPGDKSVVVKDDFEITATIVHDDTTTPADFEVYTAEEIKAWENAEWSFCGVVMSVSYKGVMLEEHAASLWGIDLNFPGGDNSYLAEVARDFAPEALEAGKAALTALREKINS